VFLDFGCRRKPLYSYSLEELGPDVKKIQNLALWFLPPRNIQAAEKTLLDVLKYIGNVQNLDLPHPQEFEDNFGGELSTICYSDLSSSCRVNFDKNTPVLPMIKSTSWKMSSRPTYRMYFQSRVLILVNASIDLPDEMEPSAMMKELYYNYPAPGHKKIAPRSIIDEYHRLQHEWKNEKDLHSTTVFLKRSGMNDVVMAVKERQFPSDLLHEFFATHNLPEQPSAVFWRPGQPFSPNCTVYDVNLQPGTELHVVFYDDPDSKEWVGEGVKNWMDFYGIAGPAHP